MHISALSLQTPNLLAQHAFYTEVLGLPSIDAPEGMAFQVGSSLLTFRAAPVNRRPVYHVAFHVPFAQFAAAQRLVRTHTPLLTDPGGAELIMHDAWDAVAFYFVDPAGNILECIARRNSVVETNSAPQGPGITGIAEIGLVTDDVPSTTAALGDQLGLAPYRGSAGDSFTALGDDTGLLIVVQRKRPWWPTTTLLAAPAPLTIELVGANETRYLVFGPPYAVKEV
jgi:catechol-2,3-dioxygenase